MEIFEHNYINDIRKLPHTPKPKEIFREGDIAKLEVLKTLNYPLWRFLMIFHASQSRIVEMRNLKISDINSNFQTFTVFEKKGRRYHNVLKPVNIHTANLWKELLGEAEKGDTYLFGKEFKPSPEAITGQQFDIRRKVWFKKAGITLSPYALRHTFANAIANSLGIAKASEALGHKNIRTTEIYAVDYKAELVKKQAELSSPLFEPGEVIS